MTHTITYRRLLLFASACLTSLTLVAIATADEPPSYDHAKLLFYRNDAGELAAVESPDHWAARRQHILEGIEQAMGPFPAPERRADLDVQISESVETDHYVRHTLTFVAEPDDRVPAYLLVPKDLKGKAPAMLCLHQTVAIGKGEPVGMGERRTLHYAHELAQRGYVCLAPDYPSFGDYQYDFAAHRDRYASGSMKAIWNNVRAIDLLESLPEVDKSRIGCIGHSLGGHNALFTAAFEPRISAVVTSCGFTAFHHYYGGKLAGWTSDRYMPRIRDLYDNDPERVPFDFHEVLGAIAPRSIFVNAPLHDDNFDVNGVRKVIEEVGGVYRLLDTSDNLHAEHPDVGHDFPDEVRMRAYEWLDSRLKN